VLALSGVTDPYQPVERQLELTRRCLQVLAEYRNPVCLVTKNHLVTRDLDLLRQLAVHRAISVHVSITSLDGELLRRLEPRASSPAMRLAAIKALAEAGIPVGVFIAPVIPAVNDHELPAILAAAAEAGAGWGVKVVLRLPYAVAPMFEDWLERNLPARKAKVLSRIRALRGGKLDDGRFGVRMRGEGLFAEQISRVFAVACRRAGLATAGPELSAAAFRRPAGVQMDLFR
jgi:DNA repair photolyase